MNKTTFKDAVKLVSELRAMPGLRENVIPAADGCYTLHSFSVRNPYENCFNHVVISLRHPTAEWKRLISYKGHRRSATIRLNDKPAGTFAVYATFKEGVRASYSWDRFMACLTGSLESANI